MLSLSVVPAEFQDREDGGRLRSKLEDQGVKWYQLINYLLVNRSTILESLLVSAGNRLKEEFSWTRNLITT
ncbi:hypothetical protein F4859DRAFT_471775 [Xylaria cf. heliscus]|nr:hypothetical protein F4859DRAFT_471775 [Xylaria cf. heliscus]